ncbi:hypothetical protein NO932_16570 [Pelagibacterium sp. 26DY04]|uniref:hypothetical protein n=1 Tax=Pelagibacterium sp. 26DY04 TaxID=2967130 RepID=UPI0028157291|nr:hypothetical protein [Pelagibacterium sp. 26DY04]WMT86506.1 hypothetical protein NO932_16570 [Pelagibacterium sp. 26DY04]
MSALTIYENAPLGSLIRYSDGTPRPPARFTRKLKAWERRNGVGRLVRKEPAHERPTYSSPATFVLHEGKFSASGVTLISVMCSYTVDSDLSFEVAERPAIGMVRVIQPVGENAELLHLAESREAAELWVSRKGYSSARLEEITADEVGADVVEGRAAMPAVVL